jgi:hypothetical protein
MYAALQAEAHHQFAEASGTSDWKSDLFRCPLPEQIKEGFSEFC